MGDESEQINEWIGEEELNSVYTDAISAHYREGAIRVAFGQIISKWSEEKKIIKTVQSLTTDPRVFKYVIVNILNQVLEAYEEEIGEIERE